MSESTERLGQSVSERRYSLSQTFLCDTDINQLVLPEVYHDISLQGLHDEAGHQGRDCKMLLVKSRFYWPGMDGDIKKFV